MRTHFTLLRSNGKLVIIGGYTCQDKQSQDNNHPLSTIALDNISIYDTTNAAWLDQPKVNGMIPSPRVYHSAILASKFSIIKSLFEISIYACITYSSSFRYKK
jgi:hypothetical protein